MVISKVLNKSIFYVSFLCVGQSKLAAIRPCRLTYHLGAKTVQFYYLPKHKISVCCRLLKPCLYPEKTNFANRAWVAAMHLGLTFPFVVTNEGEYAICYIITTDERAKSWVIFKLLFSTAFGQGKKKLTGESEWLTLFPVLTHRDAPEQ